MENEMTFEQMEMALIKCGTQYPEMLDVVVMLQQNDLRNSETLNRTVNSVDKTVDTMAELANTVQEMSEMLIQMKKEIKELEEEIEKMKKGDNVEEKTTIEMCNDVVEAVENGNDDDFLASYMELTAALKAEVQQDIENEKELYGDDDMEDVINIHSEMTYGDSTIKVLCDGRYNGIRFWIMNIRGSHPCGYIEVPKDHPYYNLTYQEGAYLPVHGGVTFSEDHLNDVVEDTWILGWDYGHFGDKTLHFGGERHYVADIIDEVKEAINYLIEQ
jgi:hypothetical protein